MAEFMLELLTEDIPARMQAQAAADLAQILTTQLAAIGFSQPPAVIADSTPRRLVLAIADLAEATEATREEKRGPRADAPAGAIEGFLKSAGLSSLDQAERRETPKGTFLFAVIERPGQATRSALPPVIAATVAALGWPKSMRWGTGRMRWVRPLRGVLALYGGVPLQGEIVLGGEEPPLSFSDHTFGHRFLAPVAIRPTGYADYVAQLRAAHVMVPRVARREAILAEGRAAARALNLRLRPDEGLLEEVVGLVEWPVPLIGRIDPAFMALPPEVLVTSMRTHQKYFALEREDGTLAPHFLTIANMVTSDGGATILAGNERVLRARLSDARFFYESDLTQPLEAARPRLAAITFHARLGTLADRVARLEPLAAAVATSMGAEAHAEAAWRAAALAKCDLVSGMVGEFPELQGVMGRAYALAAGESAAVADAIAQHYAPAGPSDRVPTAPVAVALALAEKLDTLVGFFAIDEKPTGSKDPFSLRRAALGIIRLVLENRLRVDLGDLTERAHGLYATALPRSAAAVREDLLAFLADRMTVVLRDRGLSHDLVAAALAVTGARDLVALVARADALRSLLASDDGANLLTAYRRAANLVRTEAKRPGTDIPAAVDPAALTQDEEHALVAALDGARSRAAPALQAEDYGAAMAAFAVLRGPVDAFFERVTVNAPEPALRLNRLALLNAIRATLDSAADFSRIEG